METSKRLTVLENSLLKKKAEFDRKLQHHMDTVKQANGQPLNDKRNGQATLNRWERQNDSLRRLKEGIKATEEAIEHEKMTLRGMASVKDELPAEINELLENNVLVQWRKHPNFFFVVGVEKARIIWDPKTKTVAHRYATHVPDQAQYSIFRDVYNELSSKLKAIPA